MADENDVVFDNSAENLDDSVVAEEHMGDTVKKLRERLKGAEEKAKEYLDSWQRAQADFINLRKRDEEAKADFLKFAKSDVLGELIPVLDAFDQAMSHGAEGVEPIYKLFVKTLSQQGLEVSNPIGKIFDPRFHEAIAMVEVNDKSDDHKILEVMQKGYILSGKILRPAKVKVGEYKN